MAAAGNDGGSGWSSPPTTKRLRGKTSPALIACGKATAAKSKTTPTAPPDWLEAPVPDLLPSVVDKTEMINKEIQRLTNMNMNKSQTYDK